MSALLALHAAIGTALLVLILLIWANRRAMPRLEPVAAPSDPGQCVSVLIPARNEAAKIERCVRSWALQTHPDYEILVYDDQSEDDTAARAVAVGGDRVRVLSGDPLPEDWRGKPYACHRLRAAARGDLLVFADADIAADPDTLAATAAAFERLQVDALSAIPLHSSPSLRIRALVSIQNWSALTFVPSWLPLVSHRATFAAVNGQFVVMRPALYDAVGGFEAVRDTLAEDVALGRILAEHGHRVPLVDGTQMLACTPYDALRQVWTANTRNLVPIFFESSSLLLLAMLLLALVYLGPFALLARGLIGRGSAGAWIVLPLVEIGLGLFQRRLADARCGYSSGVTLLHPMAIASLVAMAVGSVFRYRVRGNVEWRGRRYRVAR